MNRLITGVVLIFQSLILSGQDYRTVKDYKYQYLIQENNKYSLYQSGTLTNSIHFELIASGSRSMDKLGLKLPENHALFIDNQLVIRSVESIDTYLSLDSLFRTYQLEKLQVTLVADPIDFSDLEIKLLRPMNLEKVYSNEYFNVSARSIDSEKSDTFMTIIFFVMTVVVGFRTLQKKAFEEYFSLTGVISFRQRWDSMTFSSAYSLSNISFVFLYSLLIGAGVWIYVMQSTFDFIYFQIGNRIPSPGLVGLQFGLLSFLLMLLKHPLLQILSGVFHVKKVIESQYFAYLRLSLLLSVSLFIVLIFLVGIGHFVGYFQLEFFQKALIFIMVARVLYVFFILNKELSFHKIHLFIYLCGTELIPQIVLLKLLVK